MPRQPVNSIPTVVVFLGYGGLIPFVCLTAATIFSARYSDASGHSLLIYAAVILSFVGAINWGVAMASSDLSEAQRNYLWIWSVAPALIAWLAHFFQPTVASGILIAGFIAQYVQDRRLARTTSLSVWYIPLRLRLTSVACACLAIASVASFAKASSAEPLYRSGRASGDGIGKFYMGREIAKVMGFEGSSWLDRATRDQEERPDLLIKQLGLVPGMTVADIGAGSGYLSRRIAPLISPGKLFAVDVQPEMIVLLKVLAGQSGMSNVTPVQGSVVNDNLAANSVDLGVMVDVYHELAFPYEMTQSLVLALKPRARLIFVEYRAEDPTVAIKALHKMSVMQLRREMKAFPLSWESTVETLPTQHIIVFRKMSFLRQSRRRSSCEWQGEDIYFDVQIGAEKFHDACSNNPNSNLGFVICG